MTNEKVSVSTRETGRRPTRNKYNANGRRIDGYWFASDSEAKRYEQLKIMVEEGVIDKLELQPEYKIMLKNQHITTYRGDFRYAVLDDMGRIKKVVLEDVKGMVTDVYLIKKKLVEAEYGIKIIEIPASKVNQWAGITP